MGTINLLLPETLSHEAREALAHSRIRGGPDDMPTPTTIHIKDNILSLNRSVDESGHVMIPIEINGFGQLMTSTSTLIEKDEAYPLLVELARGKVNQVRCQTEDWRMGGLQISPLLQQEIREASRAFGRCVTQDDPGAAIDKSTEALLKGHQSAEQLVNAYITQVLQIRQQRQPRLETLLSSRLYPGPSGAPDFLTKNPTAYLDALNSIAIPFSWHHVEQEEAIYSWDQYDQLLDWAIDHGWQVTGGPLIDFASSQLPGWLWLWEGDLNAIASLMCKYVETAVHRYHRKINRWVICAAPNCARVLRLSGEELLGLTYRMLDAARQIDPSLELVISLGQPWGEHLTDEPHLTSSSPYFFVDTLIRAGANHLSALDVEIVMGPHPRGSYCRDLLEASRIIDLYAFLGLPLHVTLGYPATTENDPLADPEATVDAGYWRNGFNPDSQADWARNFARLAIAKPFVQSIQWTHLSDSEPHLFPNCGLVDANGNPRPALEALQQIREERLK